MAGWMQGNVHGMFLCCSPCSCTTVQLHHGFWQPWLGIVPSPHQLCASSPGPCCCPSPQWPLHFGPEIATPGSPGGGEKINSRWIWDSSPAQIKNLIMEQYVSLFIVGDFSVNYSSLQGHRRPVVLCQMLFPLPDYVPVLLLLFSNVLTQHVLTSHVFFLFVLLFLFQSRQWKKDKQWRQVEMGAPHQPAVLRWAFQINKALKNQMSHVWTEQQVLAQIFGKVGSGWYWQNAVVS